MTFKHLHTTLVAVAVLLTLVACETGSQDPCPGAADLNSGTISATLDGAGWVSSGNVYSWGGTSLEIVTPRVDGYNMTIVGQLDDTGAIVQEMVDYEAFPFTVVLDTGAEGGWALLYPENGASFSTEKGEGGTMIVQGLEDGNLLGCFDFDVSDGSVAVAMEDGLFRLPQ